MPIAKNTRIRGGYKTSDDSNWRKAGCLPLLSGFPMKRRTPAIAINNSPTSRWMSVFMSMVSFASPPGDQPHESGAPSDPEGEPCRTARREDWGARTRAPRSKGKKPRLLRGSARLAFPINLCEIYAVETADKSTTKTRCPVCGGDAPWLGSRPLSINSF